MKSVTGWMFAGAVLLSPLAYSQGANPAGANPATPDIETGTPSVDMVNVQDIVFLRQFFLGNSAEVELGHLADGRAMNEGVQEFAQRMITDHGMVIGQLEALARGKDVPLPGELAPHHQAVREQLQALEGEAFDVAYIRAQVTEHQRAVQLLGYQIGLGQSEEVRTFAKETLMNVFRHLELARGIHADLTGAAP